MFIDIMSGEQITEKNLNKMAKGHAYLGNSSKKVNINQLLSKIREERTKDKKENYIFLGLICGIIVVTVIISSL